MLSINYHCDTEGIILASKWIYGGLLTIGGNIYLSASSSPHTVCLPHLNIHLVISLLKCCLFNSPLPSETLILTEWIFSCHSYWSSDQLFCFLSFKTQISLYFHFILRHWMFWYATSLLLFRVKGQQSRAAANMLANMAGWCQSIMAELLRTPSWCQRLCWSSDNKVFLVEQQRKDTLLFNKKIVPTCKTTNCMFLFGWNTRDATC